jgi:heparosan-N-sulfate-glucuronate 5-epimerase
MIHPKLPKSTISNINQIHTWTKYDNNLTLGVGDIQLSEKLGKYCINMVPALPNYTNQIFGEFDKNGIPLIGKGNYSIYFSITIAQYGFILHDIWIENKHLTEYYEVMLNCLDWFENNKEEFNGTFAWRCPSEGGHYPMSKGWTSAMAQGEIISFYLRMYQILKDESLLETARKAYKYMKIEVKDGGVCRYDEHGDLWLEEYPTTDRPSYVLNGFIYAVFGLFDLYRVTGDTEVKKDIDACILTLKKNIHTYDAGYWSYYDHYYKELVMYYYQKNVHVPQLEALFGLTKEPIFLKYAVKWKKQLTWYNYTFVQIMYRVLPRYRKLLQLLKK